MKTLRRVFRIGENTRMAFETLRDHKVRSILTVLGVFIAVVVLIVVFPSCTASMRICATSTIPLISAVGHETDTTLIDSPPTAARRRRPRPPRWRCRCAPT